MCSFSFPNWFFFRVWFFSDRGQGRDYYTFAFDDPEEFFEEDSLPG